MFVRLLSFVLPICSPFSLKFHWGGRLKADLAAANNEIRFRQFVSINRWRDINELRKTRAVDDSDDDSSESEKFACINFMATC